jgi:DNA-binding NtrC family response regulator
MGGVIAMQDDRPTILVIDDDVDVLETETIALEEFGYNAIPCSRDDEALEIVASDIPLAMVLTDIVMVGSIDGWHLAERIRAVRPNLKIAFTSGYVMPSTAAEVVARGVLFLPKPWKATEFAEFVRGALAT